MCTWWAWLISTLLNQSPNRSRDQALIVELTIQFLWQRVRLWPRALHHMHLALQYSKTISCSIMVRRDTLWVSKERSVLAATIQMSVTIHQRGHTTRDWPRLPKRALLLWKTIEVYHHLMSYRRENLEHTTCHMHKLAQLATTHTNTTLLEQDTVRNE